MQHVPVWTGTSESAPQGAVGDMPGHGETRPSALTGFVPFVLSVASYGLPILLICGDDDSLRRRS